VQCKGERVDLLKQVSVPSTHQLPVPAPCSCPTCAPIASHPPSPSTSHHRPFPSCSGPLGHTNTVWCVAFNRAGTLLASCSSDCTLGLWRATFEGSQPCFTLEAKLSGYHSRTIYSCSWSAGGVLATGGGTGDVTTGWGFDCGTGMPM
jgi:WD40 repeat protein